MYLKLEEILKRIDILDLDIDYYLERLKNSRLISDLSYYKLILGFSYEEKKMLINLARLKHDYIV